MREYRCPDPCGRKPCVWWECADPEKLLALPPHARLVLEKYHHRLVMRGHPCVVRARSPISFPADIRVEVHHLDFDRLQPWLSGWGRAWTLLLTELVPQQDDDLTLWPERLTRAREVGCDRALVSLVAGNTRPELRALIEHDRAYRYRLFSLLRGLCDEHGLKFALFEPGDVPEPLRFNRFFASTKICCRGFPT